MKLGIGQRVRATIILLRWWWRDVRLLFVRTGEEFLDDQCFHVAASLSYYVLFSIFPLALLAVSITGLILRDEDLQNVVIQQVLSALPIAPGAGWQELHDIIEGVVKGSAVSGFAGLVGLAWSGSAVMAALRYALNQAWDVKTPRPFLRAKLLDALMLVALAGLLGLSIGATMFLQLARRISEQVSDFLGPFGVGARLSFEIIVFIVPLLISFATFLLIYRVFPNVRVRVRDIWPGALLAAVLFELAKIGFAFYLRYFGQYDRIYGSLGAVVAFQFFVYIGANVLLLGAEMASEWSRIVHGLYDDDINRTSAGGTSLQKTVLSALTGLVRSSRPPSDKELDPTASQDRRRRRAEELAAEREQVISAQQTKAKSDPTPTNPVPVEPTHPEPEQADIASMRPTPVDGTPILPPRSDANMPKKRDVETTQKSS